MEQSKVKMLNNLRKLSIITAILIAAGIVMIGHRWRKVLVNQVHNQADLEMADVSEHIQEYFVNIAGLLRAISFHEDVKLMNKEPSGYIQAVYEDSYDAHRLSEIYIIRKDFDGTDHPFMTFEVGDEEYEIDEVHSLENEEEEYNVQIEHIRRFAKDSSLQLQISNPVDLCIDKQGIVCSVPIRSEGKFVGIVAGMIPVENVSEVLEVAGNHEMVIMSNERGNFIACADMEPDTLDWFNRQFEKEGISGFYRAKGKDFMFDKYTVSVTNPRMPDANTWYLAFLHQDGAHFASFDKLNSLATYGTAATMILLGFMVNLLCRGLQKRMVVEEALHQANDQAELINSELQASSQSAYQMINETAKADRQKNNSPQQ